MLNLKIKDFWLIYISRNIIYDKTGFKNPLKPTCINLIVKKYQIAIKLLLLLKYGFRFPKDNLGCVRQRTSSVKIIIIIIIIIIILK